VLQTTEHEFLPATRPGQGDDNRTNPDSSGLKANEDLPYRVELWNLDRTAIEQVLAIAANASIGYSAFYAAARDHFDRYITLRHKTEVINRWNAPPH